MWNNKRVGVIIPAAGSGSRMGGGQAKQFYEIEGKVVLLRVLEAFHFAPEPDLIAVAVRDGDRTIVQDLVSKHRLSKVVAIVTGGKERQDSVWNALHSLLDEKVQIVLIHDAARPFVSGRLIREICKGAEMYGAAIPGIIPKDTIKRSDEKDFVESTLPRDSLRLIQTPQGFDVKILRNAFDQAMKSGYYGTDESSLVERAGSSVRILDGSYDNMKITTPEDLHLAGFLARRLDQERA